MPVKSGPARILEFWRAVELFSPLGIPEVNPRHPEAPVCRLGDDDLVPWGAVHPLARRRRAVGMVWRHTAFLGVYGLAGVRQLLEEQFGRDPESFDERRDGQSCVIALGIAHDGRPLFETLVLSTTAWAAGRTLRPGPQDSKWLEGFDAFQEELKQRISARYALADEDAAGQRIREMGSEVGRPVAAADLRSLTGEVAHALGIDGRFDTREIRIRSSQVSSERQYSTDNQDVLNSFYVHDLGRVSRAVDGGSIGPALSSYLQEQPNVAARTDVVRHPTSWRTQLSPERFPTGRWPSAGHHPLVFSQQLAVNALFQRLGTGAGLHAINGPPGTGKTTLLRDLVAAVVVERARALARLSDPGAAFTGEKSFRSGKFRRKVALWRKDLAGFEIVVASSNNGAVENVTKEIPGREAVDPSWLAKVDYFADVGGRLIERPAWALIAAPLGKKKNRRAFVTRFWFGESGAAEGDASFAQEGLRARVEGLEIGPGGWPAAVARFKTALDAETRLRQERIGWAWSINRLDGLAAERVKVRERTMSAGRLAMEARHRQNQARTSLAVAEQAVVAAEHRRQTHRAYYPRLLTIIFSLGRALREWRTDDARYAAFVREAEAAHRQQGGEAVATEHLAQAAAEQAAAAEQDWARLEAEYARCEETVREAQRRLGAAFPRFDEWQGDEAARELAAPWADRAWNDARATVFLEALALHRAFLATNAEQMRGNLDAAIDILQGRIPADAASEALASAWASLFFVVPVVSTTFASFDRLFAHLGRESLGWLLIDEAGQSAPQQAAGALWRARRAVVVGDPLQLEPVVIVPFTAQQALRRRYDVSDTWLPGDTSAQELADRVSTLGTWIARADGPLWVGSPLRVHRRCDRPMFEISNRIAYAGLMVYGTPERPPLAAPESAWFNVTGAASDGHWVPSEGEAARALLDRLTNGGLAPDQIFLISPFRSVVDHFADLVRTFPGVREGTIHTVQGKEADAVLLVLGGDPRRPGAKRWASEKPNLVNVAASRAKRRLYVIGDRESWRGYPYFSEVARLLREVPGTP